MSVRDFLTRDIGFPPEHPVSRAVASGGVHMVVAALLLALGLLLLPFGPDALWNRAVLGDGAAQWATTPAADRTMVALNVWMFSLIALLSSVYLAAGPVFGWGERRRGMAGLATIAAATLLAAAAILPLVFTGFRAVGGLVDGLPGSAERFGFAANLFIVLAPVANVIFWVGVAVLSDGAHKEGVVSRLAAGVGGVFAGMAGIVPLMGLGLIGPEASPFVGAIPFLIIVPATGWVGLLGVALARAQSPRMSRT